MLGKKGQFDLGSMEFNPMSAAMGLLGGLLSLFVMSKVEVGLIYKLGSFVLSSIVCYIMFEIIMNK